MRNFLLWLFWMLLLLAAGLLLLCWLAVVMVSGWVVGSVNRRFDELFGDFDA